MIPVDPAIKRTEFAAYTYAPPYSRSKMRMKGGLKRTAFFPIISQFASEYRLHNTYLKPEQITDPLEEYWAMRHVAGLWDVTGEEAVEVSGPDALEVMNELVPRDLNKLGDQQCLYCVMCYDYGGIIEDAVLMRFNAEKFWWVGGPAAAEQWIYSKALGKQVEVHSYLDEKHVASIQGPKSREILQRVCEADLGQVPFYGMVETRVCDIPVVISRSGFTAELGYDIYVDVPQAEALFQGLWDTGKPDGIQLCGSRALGIRRIEASILNVGQDFDWTTTPYEINIGWMVDLNKPSFCGKEALAILKQQGPNRKLIGLRLDLDRAALQGDTILTNNEPVGQITSATWSPSLDASIAMGMVNVVCSTPGTTLTVETADRLIPAEVVPMPFFDPERKLAKA